MVVMIMLKRTLGLLRKVWLKCRRMLHRIGIEKRRCKGKCQWKKTMRKTLWEMMRVWKMIATKRDDNGVSGQPRSTVRYFLGFSFLPYLAMCINQKPNNSDN